MQKMTYTIGVQGRFGRVTEYKVHSHRLEILGDRGQLVLELTDGSEIHLPDIGGKTWRVYPDLEAERQRLASLDAEINQKAANTARAMVEHQQQAALSAQQRRFNVAGPVPAQIPMG